MFTDIHIAQLHWYELIGKKAIEIQFSRTDNKKLMLHIKSAEFML